MMRNELLIAFRIRSLNNQIKRLLERSAMMGNDANLTGLQYAILGFLSEKNGAEDVFQRDIEANFNIRRSTATGMLQLLEKNGFIYRISVPEDARLKKIMMTDKSKELDKIAHENIMKLQERLTRGIPEEELEQFFSTLKKISDNACE